MDELIKTFEPLWRAAAGIDLSDAQAAHGALTARFDPRSDDARALQAALVALLAEGRVADRGEPPVTYSRAARAGEDTCDLSVDVVHMSAPGPEHRHPRGEVNYCIATDGAPTFDGSPPGWVVHPPGSQHVPTVEGGAMLIVYLLPGGEIEFLGA
ncbi:MAG: DUF4863 domain-containing protein [Planctomycetes bacterium]|jgi:hypothetical protein|nr:DUF4863 domain-containing protein [Planctomycetota bacterium]MDP6408076.1 DUF4863 family protein [Planctomycetota bacterium]